MVEGEGVADIRCFFFQAEDGIRDVAVTGVQTCALPIMIAATLFDWPIFAIIAVVIIGREIAVSAMREWMAKIGQSKSVAVNFLGKIKTISQMIAVPLLLYYDRIGVLSPQRVGTWLIYVAAILTLVSMFYYLKLALAPRAEGDRRRLDRRGSEP